MNTTKMELCSRVSKKLNKPAVDIKPVFEAIVDEIFTALAEDSRIELRGFGCFKVKTRKERTGRNPRTGTLVSIPEHKAPVFKFSKDGLKVFDNKLKNGKPKAEEKAPEKKDPPKTVEKDENKNPNSASDSIKSSTQSISSIAEEFKIN